MRTKSTKLNDSFFRKKLSAEAYHVMRQKGTELPFSGRYLYLNDSGTYCCAACKQKLFSSDSKFRSGTGWPSFDESIPKSVLIRPDFRYFMARNEVICSRCGSHLGHLFSDGGGRTDMRYCINSAALLFVPKK